jgi:hypothetical protein
MSNKNEGFDGHHQRETEKGREKRESNHQVPIIHTSVGFCLAGGPVRSGPSYVSKYSMSLA